MPNMLADHAATLHHSDQENDYDGGSAKPLRQKKRKKIGRLENTLMLRSRLGKSPSTALRVFLDQSKLTLC